MPSKLGPQWRRDTRLCSSRVCYTSFYSFVVYSTLYFMAAHESKRLSRHAKFSSTLVHKIEDVPRFVLPASVVKVTGGGTQIYRESKTPRSR